MAKNGILLTGGSGTRLGKISQSFNKHMVPITDKFVIDYPLQTLKSMGIENLTVVLGGNHFEQIVKYLKGGKDFGFNINFIYQENPSGIANAISLCQRYVEDECTFTTILGDNFFDKPVAWNNKYDNPFIAKIALFKHPAPYRFGVATIDKTNKILKIEEKPKTLDAEFENYAITGCYQFNQDFFEYYKKLKPSARNEFEITEIIQQYLANNDLQHYVIDGMWSDCGEFESIDYVREYLKNGISQENNR
jgi:glucose-1-phosphate thymidylyltransferase